MGSITVSSLGKAYREYPSRWARLIEWLDPCNRPRHQLKWVLKDISFSVKRGEAVGIIGVNGAGKSTLLKMITGTTEPTTGSVRISGRVAALLELGMGFHPDFTGRQNVYTAGQLLGFTADEISRLMPDIEAFAEIGEYIDNPIRTYSSGMQVRLAFSLATMCRPDILIVDEALSVGDSYFQHKCTERIKNFLIAGTTLLFVSHSPGAIKSLCDRAIMISDGRIASDGDADTVLDHYNALIARRTNNYQIQQEKDRYGRTMTRSGNGRAKIVSLDILLNGIPVRSVPVGGQLTIKLHAIAYADIDHLHAGILLRDRWGGDVWGTNTHLHHIHVSLKSNATKEFIFHIEKLKIAPGSYTITAALHADENHLGENYDWVDRLLTFEVYSPRKQKFVGLIDLNAKIDVNHG